LRGEQLAFVHLDADLYESTHAGLEFFYPRVPSRGFIVIHDYNSWLGARRAVDEFFRTRPELPIPMPDKSGSALVVKS
jgi:O-methyltransferase